MKINLLPVLGIFFLLLTNSCENKQKEKAFLSNPLKFLKTNKNLKSEEISRLIKLYYSFFKIEPIKKDLAECFKDYYTANIDQELRKVKYNANSSIMISKLKLDELISKVKIDSVPYTVLKIIYIVPTTEVLNSDLTNYQQIKRHSENDLYLIYCLYDTIQHKRITDYFDLAVIEGVPNSKDLIKIKESDFQICYNKYHENNSSFKYCLNKFLNQGDSTDAIIVSLNDLVVQLEELYHDDNSFDRFKLDFAQVNPLYCEIQSGKKVPKNYYEHFCLIWKPYNKNGAILSDLDYLDFNELCPPTCPK